MFFASTLLTIPSLKLIGGLRCWIGVKLLADEDEIDEGAVKQSGSLWEAVRTIIIADFVMSLDKHGGHRRRRQGQYGAGHLRTGTERADHWRQRHHPETDAALSDHHHRGRGASGWLAGDLIAHDPLLADRFAALPAYAPKVAVVGALLLVVAGRIIAARKGAAAARIPRLAGPVETHRVIDKQRLRSVAVGAMRSDVIDQHPVIRLMRFHVGVRPVGTPQHGPETPRQDASGRARHHHRAARPPSDVRDS